MLSISANLHSRPLIASLIGTTHRVEHRGRQRQMDRQKRQTEPKRGRSGDDGWLNILFPGLTYHILFSFFLF